MGDRIKRSWLLEKLILYIAKSCETWIFLTIWRNLHSFPGCWASKMVSSSDVIIKCLFRTLHVRSVWSINFGYSWLITLGNKFCMFAFHDDVDGKNPSTKAYSILGMCKTLCYSLWLLIPGPAAVKLGDGK